MTTQKKKFSLEIFLRTIFKSFLEKAATFLIKIGLTPNTITLIGLVGTIGAAILVGLGYLLWGGLLAMVMGPFDSLDGSVARLYHKKSDFGAFIDSVSDRYEELLLLAGLLFYFKGIDDWFGAILVFFAAMGSVLVSYTRARAEALGYTAKVGILTRVERYLILIPGIIFKIPQYALIIIAILGNFTAIQRIFFVRKEVKNHEAQKESEERGS